MKGNVTVLTNFFPVEHPFTKKKSLLWEEMGSMVRSKELDVDSVNHSQFLITLNYIQVAVKDLLECFSRVITFSCKSYDGGYLTCRAFVPPTCHVSVAFRG